MILEHLTWSDCFLSLSDDEFQYHLILFCHHVLSFMIKPLSLQKVDYPLELDVFDLCSDDLRKRLEAPRRVYIFFPFNAKTRRCLS